MLKCGPFWTEQVPVQSALSVYVVATGDGTCWSMPLTTNVTKTVGVLVARDYACRNGARNAVSEPGTPRAFSVRPPPGGGRSELNRTPGLLGNPTGLLTSTVHGQPRQRVIDAIPGSPPDLRRLPPGCSFAPRCPRRIADCRRAVPAPRFPDPGHMAACFAVVGAVGPLG